MKGDVDGPETTATAAPPDDPRSQTLTDRPARTIPMVREVNGVFIPLLTVNTKQLAAALGCSKRHLYNLDKAGLLGPRPIPGWTPKVWCWREVTEWLRAGCLPRVRWDEIWKRQQALARRSPH